MAARLKGTCTIWRAIGARTPSGGTSFDYVEQGSVACEIQPIDMTGQEELVTDGPRRVQVQAIFLPVGTDIKVEDQIRTSGGAYEVISVSDAQTDEVLLEVEATLL